ncbi:hypothetical protein [Massilia eburnea]|uniref:hypothetical protein n=1 Tax=Massilia eburnea TaxID=1776165 RepID=UPI003D6BC0E2
METYAAGLECKHLQLMRLDLEFDLGEVVFADAIAWNIQRVLADLNLDGLTGVVDRIFQRGGFDPFHEVGSDTFRQLR